MLLQFVIAVNLILYAKAITSLNNYGAPVEKVLNTNITNNSEITSQQPGTITVTTERPTCAESQWQCDNGDCILKDFKCDGAFHCEDGSDEKRADCKDKKRHMLGLVMHCTADRWTMKDGVCPDICRVQTEYCAYAILAEQLPAQLGVCALPDFVRNGTYKIATLNSTSVFGYKDFFLEFNCDYGTEQVGEEKPQCVNGTWKSKMPYCSETCKLKKKTEYTYTCKRDGKSKKCGDFVAIDTQVIVEKLDRRISNSTIKASAVCTEDRYLNVNTQCASVVDERQGEFEKNTMNKLSDYENKFKEVKHPSYAFEELVRNYRKFEADATKNNTDLWIQVTVCDMLLDLMETSGYPEA